MNGVQGTCPLPAGGMLSGTLESKQGGVVGRKHVNGVQGMRPLPAGGIISGTL